MIGCALHAGCLRLPASGSTMRTTITRIRMSAPTFLEDFNVMQTLPLGKKRHHNSVALVPYFGKAYHTSKGNETNR